MLHSTLYHDHCRLLSRLTSVSRARNKRHMRFKESSMVTLVYLVYRYIYPVPSMFHDILRVRDGNDRRTNSLIRIRTPAEYNLCCKPGTWATASREIHSSYSMCVCVCALCACVVLIGSGERGEERREEGRLSAWSIL